MYESVKAAIMSGAVNHIDTAPNYRYSKSEKTIGKALTTLCGKYDYKRSEFFIASKVGFIPEDVDANLTQRQHIQDMLSQSLVPEDAIQKESKHCMHPAFIEYQLEASMKRLNVDHIDLFYLQNPYEAVAPYNTDNVFFDKLKTAFEKLESLVEEGKIGNYGIASFSCFRSDFNQNKKHLSLQ